MMNDIYLFTEVSWMKYGRLDDPVRIHRVMNSPRLSDRRRRVSRVLLKVIAWLISITGLYFTKKKDNGHGIKMGHRYGLRAVQQSIRHT